MSERSRREKNLITKARVVLEIFINGCEHFNQVSLFYSQEKWLKEIKRYCGRDVKRRQLNYDFSGFRSMGIAMTYSRHRPDEIRGFEFRSTRFYIAAVGWRMAANWGIITWKKAFKMIAAIKNGGQAKYLKKKDIVSNKSALSPAIQRMNVIWKKELDELRKMANRGNNAPLPNE